jgi:hypothetical protein
VYKLFQERFMGLKVLKERRIAVLARDGFEKVELTVPVKALRLAGAKARPGYQCDEMAAAAFGSNCLCRGIAHRWSDDRQ